MIESAKISWEIGCRKIGTDDLFFLPNPWWGWCADPFLFEYENETYVFAEIWNYFTQKGSIGYFKLGDHNNKWKVIIDEKYHMSYPYIWKDATGIHICAETCGKRAIGIYDCIDFPNKWKYRKDLLSGEKYADTTFLRNKVTGNLEYCFTYIIEGINKGSLVMYEVQNDEMILDSKKIITDDSRYARPGGDFLLKDNVIYRVSQNCGVSYGESLVFHKIDNINPYKEVFVKEISYKDFVVKNCIGTHTFNSSDKFEVFDFRIKSIILANLVGTYIRYFLRRVKSAILR